MGKFTFGIVKTEEEKKIAARLVYQCFVRGQIIVPNCDESFGKTDGIITMVAYLGGDIVGTISNIPGDGKGSLRMERLFSKDINNLRAQGFKLHEVSRLAIKEGMPIGLVMALTRESLHCAMDCGIDFGVIEVSPAHKKMYTDIMLFEQFGEAKEERTLDDYGNRDTRMVAGKSWIPLRLDLRDHDAYKARLKQENLRAYDFYFAEGRKDKPRKVETMAAVA